MKRKHPEPHDRMPGLFLLILVTVLGAICSAVMTCTYQKADKNPGEYRPKPKRTPTRSGPTAICGVRG